MGIPPVDITLGRGKVDLEVQEVDSFKALVKGIASKMYHVESSLSCQCFHFCRVTPEYTTKADFDRGDRNSGTRFV
jgi:hypothetical protein